MDAIDMDFIIGVTNAFLLGLLVSLTFRWIRLCYAAHKLKKRQREPLDRMIEITSEEILKGVIRKREKQVRLIMNSSDQYNKIFSGDHSGIIPTLSPSDIESIYSSFKAQKISIALIPNEDVFLALEKGLISDLSQYFLNDDITMRLSELKEQYEKKIRKREIMLYNIKERNRKLREQKIEDSINI